MVKKQDIRKAIGVMSLLLVSFATKSSAQSNPPRITSITPANGKVIIRWEALTGPWLYQLQCRTSLTAAAWQNVGPSTSGLIVTNPMPSSPTCFYRIKCETNGAAALPPNPKLVGLCPAVGSVHQVHKSGGYAYMSADVFGLTVVDVSNPIAPKPVASSDVLFDGIYLAVSGSTACVTGQRSYYSAPGVMTTRFGFFVLDLTQPTNPTLLGSIEGNTIGFNGVAVSGGYAYVGCGAAGLKVIDIRNPASPVIVGTYDTPGWAQSVTVSGNFAYVADGSQGLRILNISNPAAPQNAGWLDTPGSAKAVTVAGTLAYVADNTAVRIVDVSNPNAPVMRGAYAPSGFSALDVKIQNGLAYVAASSAGLVTLSVIDPANPIQLGSVRPTSGSGTFGVSVDGTLAYAANLEGGLAIVNVATASSPSLNAKADDWFEGNYMATKPGLAVVTGMHLWDGGNRGIGGLRIVNTQNPSAPYIVGGFDSSVLSFMGAAITGDYAYLACGAAGLKVLDISNPTNVMIVGGYATAGFAAAVTISGIHAYVSDGQGLRILNLSNPLAPAPLGWVDAPVAAVSVVGGLAYVAGGNAVRIVDVSNPSAPVIKGVAAGFPAADVKVQGAVAYVAAGSAGLITLDVSNPATPRQLGSLGAPGLTLGLAVSGTWAYLANYSGGCHIVDVSNPAAPVLRHTVKTVGSVRNLILDGNWACLSDSLGTIDIVWVGP